MQQYLAGEKSGRRINAGDRGIQRSTVSGTNQRISKTIISTYIELGKMFTEQTFRVVFGDAWTGFGRVPDKFECAKRFLNSFKLRNWFSSRRFHMRRLNRVASEDEIRAWMTAIRDLLRENAKRLDMVVNCDETVWRIMLSGLLT
jgi:hypothetical protein